MKLIDSIKKKLINFIDPALIKDYEEIKKNNEVLEQQHSDLQKEYDSLERSYERNEKYYEKGKETIKKLSDANANLNRNITDKILQVLEPQLKDMSIEKFEFLYNKFNHEDQQLKEVYRDYKDFDKELEIYLSKGALIDEASKKLLGDQKLWHLFPEEDARGAFEGTNGYDNARWREKYHYGKVIDIEYIKCYEFYKYKLDYSIPEYVEYKKKLYIDVIPKEISKYLDYILEENNEILSNTEHYFKVLEQEFQNEKSKKLEKIEEIEYNVEENTEEEEEDEVDEI